MSKEESAKITSFIRDSFGKASSRKLTEDRKNSLKKNLDMFLQGKKEGEYLDDLTWSDTGMEDVFLQMDNCLSSAGEEYLYRQLHDISGTVEENNTIHKKEKKVPLNDNFSSKITKSNTIQ